METSLQLQIAGLGIVFYSPFAVGHIEEGEAYLESHFWNPNDVAEHVNGCRISAFGTGSPGEYLLRLYDGPLDEDAVQAAKGRGRLGIEVRDGLLCFRDLYDLMNWTPNCPSEQTASVESGFHRITAYTSPPQSGVLGDSQVVWLHLEACSGKPQLAWRGVPDLSGD